MNIDGQEAPGIDMWTDAGKVCFVITDASIIEYKEGLAPGMALTPAQAIKVAIYLIEHIDKALHQVDE